MYEFTTYFNLQNIRKFTKYDIKLKTSTKYIMDTIKSNLRENAKESGYLHLQADKQIV